MKEMLNRLRNNYSTRISVGLDSILNGRRILEDLIKILKLILIIDKRKYTI